MNTGLQLVSPLEHRPKQMHGAPWTLPGETSVQHSHRHMRQISPPTSSYRPWDPPKKSHIWVDPHLSGLYQEFCCSATCHGCRPEVTGATPTGPPPAFHSQILVALSVSNFSWECGLILRNSWRAEFFTGVHKVRNRDPHVPGQDSGDPGSLWKFF